MKKRILLITLLVILLLPFITNAKMVRIYDEPITEYNENLKGRIYKYGTPISFGNLPYNLEYYYNYYNHVTDYTFYNNSGSQNAYIGSNDDNENLSNYTSYWRIVDAKNYSSYIEIKIMSYLGSKSNCILENIEEGDLCYKDMKFDSDWAVKIHYYDKDNNEIGTKYYSPRRNDGYEEVLIGYNDYGEKIENINTWEYNGIISYTSMLDIVFKETDAIETRNEEFTLKCDKDKINYKDKTTCHVKANNYQISIDPITVTLEEKDDLELLDLIPSEYFSVENNDNRITITPKYISTTQENVELFSFKVKAKKEKNEIDNVTISNIQYYQDKTYDDLNTTINIENRTFLTSNPLTANPTLFKILLVSSFLIACTTLVLKRESV